MKDQLINGIVPAGVSEHALARTYFGSNDEYANQLLKVAVLYGNTVASYELAERECLDAETLSDIAIDIPYGLRSDFSGEYARSKNFYGNIELTDLSDDKNELSNTVIGLLTKKHQPSLIEVEPISEDAFSKLDLVRDLYGENEQDFRIERNIVLLARECKTARKHRLELYMSGRLSRDDYFEQYYHGNPQNPANEYLRFEVINKDSPEALSLIKK